MYPRVAAEIFRKLEAQRAGDDWAYMCMPDKSSAGTLIIDRITNLGVAGLWVGPGLPDQPRVSLEGLFERGKATTDCLTSDPDGEGRYNKSSHCSFGPVGVSPGVVTCVWGDNEEWLPLSSSIEGLEVEPVG
jgi:hypothetical protein